MVLSPCFLCSLRASFRRRGIDLDRLYEPGFGLIDGVLQSLGLGTVGWLTDANIAMLSIVLTTVWWTIGFTLYSYLAGLQEIPKEMYEAASIDGRPLGKPALYHDTIPGAYNDAGSHIASAGIFEDIRPDIPDDNGWP